MGNSITKIKLMRQIMGLKAKDIYENLGISQSNYSGYENGKVSVCDGVEKQVTEMFLKWKKEQLKSTSKKLEKLSKINKDNISIELLKELL